ncbi:MAG: ATP-binding protein [Planctomycetota bacterium]|jgi:CO dehydrogenase maturation factor
MAIMVVTGRGGVGKSTFAALAVRYFSEKSDGKILAVDSDPDTSLGEMLGVDLEARGMKTVSDLLYDIKKGKVRGTIEKLSFNEKVEYLFHDELYESDKFDLVSLGTKWDRGCYCTANNALRSIMEGLLRSYRYVVIDSPGGLEHLNRRLINDVDAVIHIVDASKKARANLERSRAILSEVGILFKHLYIVAGPRVPESLENDLKSIELAEYIGKIPEDETISAANMDGNSLFDLPGNSPAYSALCVIMEKVDI